MGIKSSLAKPFAAFIVSRIRKAAVQAVANQHAIRQHLLTEASSTLFGKAHRFDQISTQNEFAEAIPVRDYEEFKPYIEQIKQGQTNILWKGLPKYFAKTSGTTSGIKYIPITAESMPFHINTARNALLCYIAETGNSRFADGKMIFLSGSPELERVNGIYTGRLSGIVNHHVPAYLTKNRLPSYATNCIDDWEEKLERIVDETIGQDMRLISGIPPWMQMYFDRLSERSQKSVASLFPNFSVLVHGGVNFEPYKAGLFQRIGKSIHTIETFPASEGFFAFQDTQTEEGMLLNTNAGMYFEFIPVHSMHQQPVQRLSLDQVQLNVNYALIISSNAGLWAYNIGDTIRFVCLQPHRIVVTGRIKHFISAFGEHVIAEEVEYALLSAAAKANVRITEFTVAPLISSANGMSYHEWLIEFEQEPKDLIAFSLEVDQYLRTKNIYYDDLISGNILSPLKITRLRQHAFIDYMKKIGKLGGQNKVPRLSNDRSVADALLAFRLEH
jgi:hypothetical protein